MARTLIVQTIAALIGFASAVTSYRDAHDSERLLPRCAQQRALAAFKDALFSIIRFLRGQSCSGSGDAQGERRFDFDQVNRSPSA
jgi:hypothetical protein